MKWFENSFKYFLLILKKSLVDHIKKNINIELAKGKKKWSKATNILTQACSTPFFVYFGHVVHNKYSLPLILWKFIFNYWSNTHQGLVVGKKLEFALQGCVQSLITKKKKKREKLTIVIFFFFSFFRCLYSLHNSICFSPYTILEFNFSGPLSFFKKK